MFTFKIDCINDLDHIRLLLATNVEASQIFWGSQRLSFCSAKVTRKFLSKCRDLDNLGTRKVAETAQTSQFLC